MKFPVVAVLATAEPESIPKNALTTTETFAAPPIDFPVSRAAKSINVSPAPVERRNPPNMINIATIVEDTPVTNPQRPLSLRYIT